MDSILDSTQNTDNQSPAEQIRIRSNIGIASVLKKQTGAWRLWTVCRNIDSRGSGGIFREEIIAFMDSAGVNRRNTNRWISDAIDQKYFTRVIKYRDGRTRYILAGELAVAEIVELERVDTHYMIVDTVKFLSTGWRGLLWLSFLTANFNNASISRQALAKITGFDRHTQARLEKEFDITKTMNIELTEYPADAVPGLREMGVCAFRFQDKAVIRLPDKRSTNAEDSIGPKGRSRDVNKQLAYNNSLASNLIGTGAHKKTFTRLYFADFKKMERSLRKYGREDRNVDKVFQFEGVKQYRSNKTVCYWRGFQR